MSGRAAGPVEGWAAPEVRRELPALRLLCEALEVGRPGPLTGTSPGDVQERLRGLSSSIRGARAIGVRREPVSAAYRIFFRHIGLDPDVDRTPMESAVLDRMLRGGFPTAGLLEDVLLIALLDTGVAVWALDADLLEGELGIRTSTDGESIGGARSAVPAAAGRLVVADGRSPVAELFSPPAPSHAPGPSTRRLVLYALQVEGVPALFVEEALWSCRQALELR